MKDARERDESLHDATATKKRKTDDCSRTISVAVDCPDAGDQIAQALIKIRRYVGSVTKFNKAARLLLNLSEKGHIRGLYVDLFFDVLSCAMLNRDACMMPDYRKGYYKLISTAVDKASSLSHARRKQLEVYQIWTICRSELFTDDSFCFNKNMSKLKELVTQLPICELSDETVLSVWKEKMEQASAGYEDHRKAADDVEKHASSVMLNAVWTGEECLAARREALIDWVECSKSMYKRQWACTAVDMAIMTLNENKHRFCTSQRERIGALLRFSKNQKLKRRQGPSSKEKKRDTTAFEEARSDWSKARVSTRGMVGNRGDHQSEAWLG